MVLHCVCVSLGVFLAIVFGVYARPYENTTDNIVIHHGDHKLGDSFFGSILERFFGKQDFNLKRSVQKLDTNNSGLDDNHSLFKQLWIPLYIDPSVTPKQHAVTLGNGKTSDSGKLDAGSPSVATGMTRANTAVGKRDERSETTEKNEELNKSTNTVQHVENETGDNKQSATDVKLSTTEPEKLHEEKKEVLGNVQEGKDDQDTKSKSLVKKTDSFATFFLNLFGR